MLNIIINTLPHFSSKNQAKKKSLQTENSGCPKLVDWKFQQCHKMIH